MGTIRITCPNCGDLELPADDVSLEMAVGAKEGRYRFGCWYCGTTHRRPASRKIVRKLLAAGVRQEIVATASPITNQDMKRFAADFEFPGRAERELGIDNPIDEEEIAEFAERLDDLDGRSEKFEIDEE